MTRTAKAASASDPSGGRSWPGLIGWYALLALVVLLPVATSITRGAIGPGWALTDEPYHLPKLLLLVTLLGVATMAWLVDVVVAKRGIRVGPALVALAAASVLVIASTVLSYEPLSALFGASGLTTGAITWLLCMWSGVLVAQYLTDARKLRQLSGALVIGSALLAGIAALAALGIDVLGVPSGVAPGWMISQGMATTGNPDFTGLALILPAIVALGYAAQTRPKRAVRLGFLACGFVLVLGLFLTLARGAWIGLAVGLVALGVLQARRLRAVRRDAAIGAATVALATIVGVLISTGHDVLARFSAGSAGSANEVSSGRLTLWVDTLHIVARHPLLGMGADQLGLGAYEVQRVPLIQGAQRFVLQDPHNLPLLVAGVFGIPALVAFACYLAFVARSAWLALRGNTDEHADTALFAGWIAGLLGLLAASLVSVWTITAVFTLFLATGVLLAPSLRPTRKHAVAAGTAVTLAVLLFVPAVYGTVQHLRASRELVLAQSGESSVHLVNALSAAPWDPYLHTTYRWQQMLANLEVLQGSDVVAAHDTAAELDSGIVADIALLPHELLLYRLRADLYAFSRGYPGYQPELLLGALDDALRIFPDDTEFMQRRAEVLKELGRSQ